MRLPAGIRHLLFIILLLPVTVVAQAPKAAVPAAPGLETDALRPKVRLIATGGTISMRAGGRLTADDLLASIPGLDRHVRAEAEQFANTSSAALTIAQWLDLSRRISRVFRDESDLAGVVVTSGTDTLEETAYFLNLTVRTDKPIVVVGSMRNSSTIGYEGQANLLAGLRVAGDPASRGKGVLVVLNDEINAARDVTKADALQLDTFRSPYGVLGLVNSDRVVYLRTGVKRHTAAAEFDVTDLKALPRVDIVPVYQDADGDVIKALVDLGAKGLVIASAGAGAISGTQSQGLQYAISKGVVVVTSSRTGSGRIAARTLPTVPPGEHSVAAGYRIAGEDLAPVKARILLMLALATTADPAAIQRMFLEY